MSLFPFCSEELKDCRHAIVCTALHCTHRRHTAHCRILQAHGRMLPLPASPVHLDQRQRQRAGHTRRKRQTEAPHPTCCRCSHCVGIAAQTSALSACLLPTHTHLRLRVESIAICYCSTVLSDRWTTTQYHTTRILLLLHCAPLHRRSHAQAEHGQLRFGTGDGDSDSNRHQVGLCGPMHGGPKVRRRPSVRPSSGSR